MSSSTITQKIRFTILIKIWMNSSCHLLPSCKKLDATENSTRSNRKVKSATEPMHFHLVARLWVALFIWICKFHLSVTSRIVFIVFNFCIMVEDDMRYPFIFLLELFTLYTCIFHLVDCLLLPPSWNIRHSMVQNLSPNIRHHKSSWYVPNQLN
jgi:hypothetical protein